MSKLPTYALKAPSPHDEPDAADVGKDPGGSVMSTAETAQYIAEFTAELSYLARQSKLDLLAYLLDMARLEAGRAIQAGKRGK
ncbi:hypothetical protein AB4Y85_00670 [Microvirga sp. 2YAF29]|uniref:hypothetical protein n=1 Tax=Microvirga sp. 2YAF29 TaxID=3233031 RepID=UPI003F95688F